MPKLVARLLPWIVGPLLAVAFKWLFDRVLWDWLTQWLDRVVDFERVAVIVAIASYLVPLVAAAWITARLFPGDPDDRTIPVLRKHPWQSKPLIAGVLIVVVAVIAGTEYGRLFGLPSIALPAAFSQSSFAWMGIRKHRREQAK